YAPWVHKHPRVEEELAAIASGATPNRAGPSVGAEASATPATAEPARRKEFLEALARQKFEDWQLVTPQLAAHLSATGASIDSIFFNELRESSFKLVTDHDIPTKDLGPFQLLRVWDPHARSFALASNATTDDLAKGEWLHEELKPTSEHAGGHRFTRVLPDGDL